MRDSRPSSTKGVRRRRPAGQADIKQPSNIRNWLGQRLQTYKLTWVRLAAFSVVLGMSTLPFEWAGMRGWVWSDPRPLDEVWWHAAVYMAFLFAFGAAWKAVHRLLGGDGRPRDVNRFSTARVATRRGTALSLLRRCSCSRRNGSDCTASVTRRGVTRPQEPRRGRRKTRDFRPPIFAWKQAQPVSLDRRGESSFCKAIVKALFTIRASRTLYG
jgi:hypothetical protein